MGIRVPEDLSICSFSGDYVHITSIYQNEGLMAEHIGDIFTASLSSKPELPCPILVPAELQIKSSTGPRP